MFSGGSDGKDSACNVEDLGCLILGLGRSPGEWNGYPLHYSGLENSMDRGTWWATVHGGRKESDTTEWLSLHNFLSVAVNLASGQSVEKLNPKKIFLLLRFIYLYRCPPAKHHHQEHSCKRTSWVYCSLQQRTHHWEPWGCVHKKVLEGLFSCLLI